MAPRSLWLLRHTKTVRHPPVGGSDHERTLAPRGRRDADALGQHLGDHGDHLGLSEDLMPALVLCSTAVRTVETIDRVLAGLAVPPPVRYLRALYDASTEDVLEQVSMVEDDVASVMVVGHNPTFEVLVATMPTSTPGSLKGSFATCGLAVFEVPGRWDEIALRSATVVGVFHPPF
jgi:phosphohistidine phosphatase